MQRLVKTIVLGMCLAAVLPAAHAAEQPKPRLTLEQRADKARIDSERIVLTFLFSNRIPLNSVIKPKSKCYKRLLLQIFFERLRD